MAKVTWLEPFGVLTGVVTVLLAGAGYVAYRDHFPDAPPEERRWRTLQSTSAEDHYDEIAVDGAAKHALDPKLPTLSVYSSPGRTPASSPMRLQDLSDHGQAQLIDLIAKTAYQTPAQNTGGAAAAVFAAEPWQMISKTLDTTQAGPEHKDPYRADRVLIASIAKPLDAAPGDRLLWTRVLIEPVNFKFAGFTVAATETRTFKVADIEDDVTEKLAFDAGLDAVVSKPTISHSMDRSRKTTAELTEQVESLGIDIHPDFLRIIRESGAGGNVTGNTKVELSAITDLDTIWTGATAAKPPEIAPLVLIVAGVHLVESGKYLKAPHASLTVLPQDKLPHCALMAHVRLLYEARKIQDGDSRSYAEGNQTVSIVKGGHDFGEVEIVPADDISPAVWTISLTKNARPSETLQARTNGNPYHDLVFTDYTTASEVTHWLKTQESTPLSLGELSFNFDPGDKLITLTPKKLAVDECRQTSGPRG